MKKIVLNITDTDYEKFRFEAIHEQKSVHDVIRDRVFTKPFHEDVLEAYDAWIDAEIDKITNER